MEEEQDCPCGSMKHERISWVANLWNPRIYRRKRIWVAQGFKKNVTHGTTRSVHLQSHKHNYKGASPTLQGSAFSKYAQVKPPHVTCPNDQKHKKEEGEMPPKCNICKPYHT